jgi:hypothetical protein
LTVTVVVAEETQPLAFVVRVYVVVDVGHAVVVADVGELRPALGVQE